MEYIDDLKNKPLEELIELLQDGKIGFMQYVLAQRELEGQYLEDMSATNQPLNDKTAEAWLEKYESNGVDLFEVDDEILQEYMNTLDKT